MRNQKVVVWEALIYDLQACFPTSDRPKWFGLPAAKDSAVIKNIILRGVSSYSPDVNSSIGPLTKVNVFYGHNGTGKTTVGNYLQDPGDLIYHQCSALPSDADREVLVYNHIFTETNFHASSQPGVFTLNEGNIEAGKALEAAESALKKLTEERQTVVVAGNSLGEAQKVNKSELQDRIWVLKKPFDNAPLKYCLASMNTKEKLTEKVVALDLVQTSDTFELLSAEAEQLQQASDAVLPGIPALTFAEGEIETHDLLLETITGSSDSYLSALIIELGNSDWVKQALSFATKEEERCPFCQQPLPVQFYDEIRRVFDKTYEQRIGQLASLKNRYEAGVARLQAHLRRTEYQLPEFQAHIKSLEAILRLNIQSLSAKVASPSVSIMLTATADALGDLNALIRVEQGRIDLINLRVKDKKTHLDKIKSRFWNCFRLSCDTLITSARKVHKDYASQRDEKRDALDAIRAQEQIQQDIINHSKSKITNIDQSVDSINASLDMLGLKGFTVVRENGELPLYRLQRPFQQAGVFKTLSEGEKTLISFLYFLEVCNGDLDGKGGKLKSHRIIVIDDPISSLSHNYIYDIASMIYRRILNPKDRFKQVFILTHNLFFFHEMLKHLRKSDEYSLFRITKAMYSTITPMKPTDVQNDYQSFWQTIKDAQKGRTSVIVIPNMMRNILEYYFAFVHRQDILQSALLELADEDVEFRALYRYVNRESHSDAVNINDFGEVDPEHFIQRFKQVFVKTGFGEHFEKMMGE